jgi:hypothetical protein
VGAEPDKYSAAASVAGYLFQARLALAEALRFAYSDSGIEIAIEKFDDVSFEAGGEPIELLQTKHHIAKVGDLTNLSVDFWKTLRVWSDKVRGDPSLPGRVRFTLVTTAIAPAGSAAALLKPSISGSSRDAEKAVEHLTLASANSNNVSLKPAFDSFNSLAPEMRLSLLRAVDVVDRSPTLADLQKVIDERLKMIAPRGKLDFARERIEGWWYARLAKALSAPAAGTISVLELEARLDDVREVMRRNSLPVDLADAMPEADEMIALDEMIFVKQLQMVGLSTARIELAKRDFIERQLNDPVGLARAWSLMEKLDVLRMH